MQIYITTNLINEKIYVGKDTKNDPTYLGSGILISRAIKKYGIHNFKKEILEECKSLQELNAAEIKWILLLDSQNKTIGYNIAAGGDGGDTLSNHPDRDSIIEKFKRTGKDHWNYNKNLSEKTKKRISESVSVYFKNNPQAKEHLSESMKGRFAGENNPMYGQGHKVAGKKNGRFGGNGTTDETRTKISKANKGRKHTEETKKKISKNSAGKNNGMYGRSAYDIWVEKYGVEEANRLLEERKQKTSRASKGRKMSDETKEKLRKAAILREQKKREKIK